MQFQFNAFTLLRSALFATAVLGASGAMAQRAPATTEVSVAVAKDASLILSSYCCGFAADQNFGGSTTVDAGTYHHTSRALFGFTLPALPEGAVVESASLVLPPATLVVPAPGVLTSVALSLVNEDALWSEDTVTWNTAPASTSIGAFSIDAASGARLDVTDAVRAALGGDEVSFFIDSTQQNLFFPSKEGTLGAASLSIRFHVEQCPRGEGGREHGPRGDGHRRP
jgi:hypothetical protein